MSGNDAEGEQEGFIINPTNVADHMPWYSRALNRAAGPVSDDRVVDGGLKAGDAFLNHGGQTILDLAGFIPGVNIFTEGIQSGYHGIHAQRDFETGNDKAGWREVNEAAWHGGLAALNLLTVEGGQELNVASNAERAAHGAAEGAEVAHGASTAEKVMHAGEGLAETVQALPLINMLPKTGNPGVHAAHMIIDTLEAAWDLGSNMMTGLSGDPDKLPPLGGLPAWLMTGEYKGHEDGGHGQDGH